jgi:hypothetical protein
MNQNLLEVKWGRTMEQDVRCARDALCAHRTRMKGGKGTLLLVSAEVPRLLFADLMLHLKKYDFFFETLF